MSRDVEDLVYKNGLATSFLQREVDHLKWANQVTDSLLKHEVAELTVQTDDHQCALGKWYYGEERKTAGLALPALQPVLAQLEQPHHALHASAIEINAVMTSALALPELTPQAADAAINPASEIYRTTTTPQLHAAQALLRKAEEQISDEVQQATRQSLAMSKATRRNTLFMLFGALALGAVFSLLLARDITLPIKRIIDGLAKGSEQVSSASGQISQTSQSMAEGASEQAASLEEISASLENISTMTARNTDDAKQANTSASAARGAAEVGREAMQRMMGAIDRIKASSDQTAKILKTIDEIAFQTNLLALNAAVEAARAGEAGKGFAVVAEEVRALARRSAEASRDTASLIEESQKNAGSGVAVSSEVAETLDQIVAASQKVAHINAEVSTASEEQSRGIEQVNIAVAQMEKITQSNAASAEQSAAASEELSAQALELNDMVGRLVRVVDGSNAHR